MRKILYAPGWGSGWSSWMDSDMKEFACTFQPLIDALDRGEDVSKGTRDYSSPPIKLENLHPAMAEFIREYNKRRGKPEDNYVCLLGAEDLRVYTCDDNVKVRIEEYDGNESVIEGYSDFF